MSDKLWPRRSATVAKWGKWRRNTSTTIGLALLCLYLATCAGRQLTAANELKRYQETPINYDRLIEIYSDGGERIRQAKNKLDRREIEERLRGRICTTFVGGKFVSWPGYLYDLKLWQGDALAEFAIGGVSLKSTPIKRDSSLYRKLSSLKTSTWRRKGDAVVISGFITPTDDRPPCIGLVDYQTLTYQMTLTDVR